jgi:hypothetical protein
MQWLKHKIGLRRNSPMKMTKQELKVLDLVKQLLDGLNS